MKFLHVVIVFSVFITPSIQYYFGLNWGYCKHVCTDQNQFPTDVSEQAKGYYWKDYYGVVPTDAWVAGELKDGTNIFAGQVYDPANEGWFGVTIYEDVPYVFNTVKKQSKLYENIKILCTNQPEKMRFVNAADTTWEAVKSNAVYSGVIASYNKQYKFDSRVLLARSIETGLIGYLANLLEGVWYTLRNGKNMNSTNYDFITFDLDLNQNLKTSLAVEDNPMLRPKTFTWHKYHIRLGSGIIPNFFVGIKIGSCSSICSNICSEPDTMYYWRRSGPTILPDALGGARDYINASLYFLQTYVPYYNSNDLVTLSSDSGTTSHFAPEGETMVVELDKYFEILSSSNMNTLHWVPVTSETVKDYKNVAVIGGSEPDGTPTYVGRVDDRPAILPGRVYIGNNSRIVETDQFGGSATYKTFEILTYNGTKAFVPECTLIDVLLSFFKFEITLHS